MKDFKSFLREITTFKTVWIDKGQGRWTTKKRMHPVLRLICTVFVIFICGISYASYATLFSGNTQQNNIKQQIRTFSMPELPTEMPPVAKKELKTEPKTEIQMEIHKQSSSPQKIEIVREIPNEDSNKKNNKLNGENIFAGIANDNNYRIFVNKSEYTLTLYKGNEIVKQYPIAIGKNAGDKQYRGDNRTPVGNFKVVSIENASKWSHDFRDGKGKIKGAYGPWFLRLDAKGWKGIGIHGTHDPESMGKSVTEGCVRLSNENIQDLRQYAYLNMPVVIRER